MANFPPLKRHILYCVDKMVERHALAGPFLDVGCGGGDVSLHLARKNWSGTAIDLSEDALERARKSLQSHPSVQVESRSLFEQTGLFNTVLAMDVIEHLEDDVGALNKISSIVKKGGHLIVSVPSNPREWRWDDDHFGHVRRYAAAELEEKLKTAGFTVLEMWDFTFPVFWMMRRAYTKLKSPRLNETENPMERTQRSSGENPWQIPFVSNLLSMDNVFWSLLRKWQFDRFRHRLERGHEIIALGRKN